MLGSPDRILKVLVLAATSVMAGAASADLLGDGSFELSGSATRNALNPQFWRSDLPAFIDNPGRYDVVNGLTPNQINPGWRSDLQARSGTNYLIVDGPTEAGKVVLESTSDLAVTPGTAYAFSAFSASLADETRSQLTFRVEFLDGNDATVNAFQAEVLAPSVAAGWQPINVSGVAGIGATRARILVTDATLSYVGNDFALDDLGFSAQPVPEPASLVALGLGGLTIVRRRATKKVAG